jgi:hypothetical protein
MEIRLYGYVTLQDVCSHVGEIWRRARQQRGMLFAMNCSAVLDFSTLALTALGRLRKHLREFGCELTLVKSSPSVLERQDDPLVAPLLVCQMPEPPAVAEESQPPSNRLTSTKRRRDNADSSTQEPHHVQVLVKAYQRYWLN